MIGDLPVQPTLTLGGGEVALNFEEAPLTDVVHGILGDILQLNYRIENKIPGTVTIRSQEPIAKENLLAVLESMLAAHDVKMVFDGNSYVVTTSASIGNRLPAYFSQSTKNPGFKNIVVPLEYISAAQMADILKPVASDSAFVRIDDLRNILILAGTQTQLDGWLDIVETFDVDYVSGMSVAIYPIEYNTVEEVSNALATLLASSASDKSTVLTGMVRVEPLDTLGSILVVSAKPEYLKRIEAWIERLDRSPEASVEPQLYVYDVQNANASHLASLVSQVFGGSGGSGASRTQNTGVAPGLNQTDLSSSTSTSGTSRTSNTQTRTGGSSFDLDEDTRIVADESNNALLIHATYRQYKKIESALKKLDIMPSQVLIEASIIEVTLSDSLEYGLEWYFDNEFSGGQSGTGNIGFSLSEAGGEFSGSVPNFGYAFTNSLGQIQSVLNVLAGNGLLKVLSTPSLMVLDNQSASIQVGSSFAVASSTTLGDYGSTQNISYRDTGVDLEVTPSVNAGGLVTMDIMQSVSNALPESGQGGNPSFFERSIQSKVAVRSGESVILGGLISDSENTEKSGVPFLSSLPLIGWLFGNTTVTEERQELLVIITPHVMKSDQDLRDVTKEMRARMKTLKTFEESLDPSRSIGK
ncbi:type II secretion system secretin GspD [Gilvimarinus sp. 2_MG-2023]|uniref:type II secretion system secretin GspD n=1 Tax=Gilvimarinus sp. 2_MG-2023 TaxID=3062666 RepID=UPI0026E2B856|nr:type II secretion system secretin GspD [Gilvimarinus sp. 2_MG-2023]MDO6572224.1 type II secretion system secretin GspD [Gilvimarinus sp. 2_MG-2023]